MHLIVNRVLFCVNRFLLRVNRVLLCLYVYICRGCLHTQIYAYRVSEDSVVCVLLSVCAGSFAKATYNFKEPTNGGHPIARV